MAFGTGWSKTWDANALIIRYLASRKMRRHRMAVI